MVFNPPVFNTTSHAIKRSAHPFGKNPPHHDISHRTHKPPHDDLSHTPHLLLPTTRAWSGLRRRPPARPRLPPPPLHGQASAAVCRLHGRASAALRRPPILALLRRRSTAGPPSSAAARPSSPSSAAAPRPGLHPPPPPAHPLPPPAVRLQSVLFSAAASVSSPPPPLAVAGARQLCLPTTRVRYTLPTTRTGISVCNESLTNLSVEDSHILSRAESSFACIRGTFPV